MEIVRLKEVAKVISGITAPKKFDSAGDIPFYRAGSLEKLIENEFEEKEKLNSKDFINKTVPAGTILFAKSGMSILKNRVYKTTKESVIVSHLMGIIPNEELIDGDYLKFYFKKNKPSNFSNSSSYPSLKTSDIQDIIIKVPEIEIQKSIAEELDNIQMMIDIRKKDFEDCNRLINSKLNSYSILEERRMDDVFNIIDGDRGKNYPKQDEFHDSGYCLFLNTGNVTKTGFDFSTISFITKEKDEALRKGKLQREDLIMTTRGTLGNIAYYSSDVPYDNLRINSGMVILRKKDNDYNNKYLEYLLRSEKFQEEINDNLSGTAQPQIPIGTLKTIKINYISKEDQDDFINYCIGIESMKEKIQDDIADLNQLIEIKMANYYN